MKNISLCIVNFALCIAFTSCSYIEQRIKEYESDGIVASIGDNYLYKEDILHLVPIGTNSEDSIAIIDAYIQRWATDILILKNAERNVSNQEEINRMVENYRRTLIIHYYKQDMVNEKVKIPTDEATAQFYETNKHLFVLKHDIVKGAIMKVPNNIKTDKIQRKFKDLDNISEIEKYALQYAKHYQLFTEYWLPIDEIIDEKTSKLKINKTGYYEELDSMNLTLINITEFIPQGEIAPLEMIKDEVRATLHNQQKMEYLNNFGKEIYNHAIRYNQLKIKK